MLRRKKKDTLTVDEEKKPSKYKNKKVTYDGIEFDSTVEKDFYIWLLESGVNKDDIIIQPKFTLMQGFKLKGKLIRPIVYVADFQIGKIVYDVKGMITEVAKIKVKMFKSIYKEELNLICVKKAARYMTGRNWVTIEDYNKRKKQHQKLTVNNSKK